MKELKQQLEKEYIRKGKPLTIKAVFKSLEEGSRCMVEVENVFDYLKYFNANSYINKYNADIVLNGKVLNISISYKNLTLMSSYKLKDNKNIKQFADLYNNTKDDILYFISSINEVELLSEYILFNIDILEASSSLVSETIIK